MTAIAIARPTPALSEGVRRTRLVLATGVALLFPLIGLPRQDQRADLPLEYSYYYVADGALVAVALLGVPRLVGALRTARGLESLLWPALYMLLAVAFALRPSANGLDILIRLSAGAALYFVIADADVTWRRRIAAAMAGTAAVQAVVSLLQVITGGPLGLRVLGEMHEGMIYRATPMARGTLGHEFILAALAILTAFVLAGEALRSRRPALWLVPAAVAISTAGLIYGRSVLLSVVLGLAVFAVAGFRDRRYRTVVLALFLGFAVPAIAIQASWTASLARGLTSERSEMMLQAVSIIEEQPFFGVGPGNYVRALQSRPELHYTPTLLSVHNIPALLASEAGMLAGIVSAALLALIGLRCLRAGTLAAALYACFIMWMTVDVLPYVTPQGVVLTAFWLGFIRHAERDRP